MIRIKENVKIGCIYVTIGQYSFCAMLANAALMLLFPVPPFPLMMAISFIGR